MRQADGTTFLHEYTIKDHLGNARVTYSDANSDGFIAVSDIKQINHYYPFGMNMEGNWNGAAGSNKYQYNQKEWNDDFGLGLNDYGARWYQSDNGRWLAIDPMAEMYTSMSPYHYGKNSPMVYADPTGMMSEAYNFGMSGSSGNAYDTYNRDAAIAQHGKAREATDDDIAGSGNGGSAYGHYLLNQRTGERTENVIEGFNVMPNDGFLATYSNGKITYQRISGEGGNDYDVIYSGCIPCGTGRSYRINNTSGGIRIGVGAWSRPLATGALESVDDPVSYIDKAGLKIIAKAAFLGIGIIKAAGRSIASLGLKDGMTVTSTRALELGGQFLGSGYRELVPGSGRFVSADGTRVFRMGVNDITGAHGGGPHVNFETLIPNSAKPGKMMVNQNIHIYIAD